MYISNTDADRKSMLHEIGVESFEELLSGIPEAVRFRGSLNLAESGGEIGVERRFAEFCSQITQVPGHKCFAGCGIYRHYIPPAVKMAFRREFLTAYTPYQPEVSQGMLQAIWEYQSYICMITGMAVSNASSYDGGTAFADAGMMAIGATKRNKILVSPYVHPQFQNILKTYVRGYETQIDPLPYSTPSSVDLDKLAEILATKEYASVAIALPNFLGVIELEIAKLAELCHKFGTLLHISYYPFFAGVSKTPGELGADIVTGEGQSLGIPPSFGGPGFGFLAATEKLVRNIPGRLVGRTDTPDGKTAFVLTLQAREQHIRREKATSNLCTNQALLALAATVYMSLVGKTGFIEVAKRSAKAAHHLYDLLLTNRKIKPLFASTTFFNEFAVQIDIKNVSMLLSQMSSNGYLSGIELKHPDLTPIFPMPYIDEAKLSRTVIFACTEQHQLEDIERFAGLLNDTINSSRG